MDNFLRVIKNGFALLVTAVALVVVGTASAGAASYTYALSDVGGLTGTITTSCNNCVLNASNITAFNIADAGLVSVSSSMSGSKVILTGSATDMVATPTEIDFNFSDPGKSYSFTTAQTTSGGSNNEIIFASTPDGCSSCIGIMLACPASSLDCDIFNPTQFAGPGGAVYRIAKATSSKAAPRASLFGMTVTGANQQIVDGQFDVWTLSGGQAYRNSIATPTTGIILLVYYDGIVYQENSAHQWLSWLNGRWAAATDPRTVSAGSTTIPHETHLVDSSHCVWTLSGGQVYANGYLRTSNSVIQLLYAKGIIYQENSAHKWWLWGDGEWVATTAPLVASSSGSTIASSGELIDSQLQAWTLSGGSAYVNGKYTPSGSIILLLYYNGGVYQENNAHNWWQWKSNGWTAITADPRVPSLAAAAGYRYLTFDSTVLGNTSGTWQTSNLDYIPGCANAAVQNDDGSFTVNASSIQQCYVTTAIKSATAANGWTGVTFKPGMYLKLVVSAVGTNNPQGFSGEGPPSNVPGFWGTSIEHADGGKKANGALLDQWPGQAPSYEHWMEADFMTAFCYSCDVPVDQVQIGYRDRAGVNGASPNYQNDQQSGDLTALPGTKTWATQHTLEYVWVPATGSTKGHIDGYVDGTKFTTDGKVTWTPYNAASPPANYTDLWSIGDTQDMVFVTGTGIYADVTVYSVQVWQASTTGTKKQ